MLGYGYDMTTPTTNDEAEAVKRAMAILGRRGGRARASKMTVEELKARARKAGLASQAARRAAALNTRQSAEGSVTLSLTNQSAS